MKSDNDNNTGLSMSTKRIETLVDGIFAIAMTLLVLSLEVPRIPYPATNAQILDVLTSMAPQFFIYILSFLLLATFWRINHAQFHLIKKTDQGLLWINVFWLLLVALVPFSTNLVGDYGYLTVPMVFFHLNLLLIGLVYNWNWYHASSHGFLDESLDENFIRSQKIINLTLPVCALVAIVVSFFAPEYSPMIYILTFFVKRVHS